MLGLVGDLAGKRATCLANVGPGFDPCNLLTYLKSQL